MRRLSFQNLAIAIFIVSIATGLRLFAETPPPENGKPATIQALKEFNSLIGTWRGVGQLKRGSQTGAWQERAESVWELKPQSYGIRWNVDAGKYWKSALIGFDEAKMQYTLITVMLDDSSRTYRGKIDEKATCSGIGIRRIQNGASSDLHGTQ